LSNAIVTLNGFPSDIECRCHISVNTEIRYDISDFPNFGEMPMRSSLATLRVFATVAESGNIRLAAGRLGRTPSSISEKLKQFEQ
jgi:hypothetical protein